MKTKGDASRAFWLAAALAAMAAALSVCSPPVVEGSLAGDKLAPAFPSASAALFVNRKVG